MNTTVIVAAIIALLAGAAGGYIAGIQKNKAEDLSNLPKQQHRMPDGSLMHDGDQAMNMEGMMKAMNDELRGKSGDAFDQAFIDQMIMHHQGAVGMAELATANAKHQEIKDLANAIITAQNKEIADMQTWQQEWYGK